MIGFFSRRNAGGAKTAGAREEQVTSRIPPTPFRGRIIRIALLLLPAVVLCSAPAFSQDKSNGYVRFSKPDTLTFPELVELSQKDTPDSALATKLDHLPHTPFLSNEAYFDSATPKRHTSKALGPYLRATFWNIERGMEFDSIRTALVEPDKFDQVIAEKKDPDSTSVSGVENTNTLQSNSRVGVTLSTPISRHQSLKFSYNAGAYINYGGNYHNLSLAWQYSWLGKPN